MPETPEVTLDTLTPEARAELLAEARAMVTGTVVTAAQHRHASEPGMVGVSLRTILSPRGTDDDRRANILTAAREAGILAEGFRPSPIEGVKLTPGQVRCLTLQASGHTYTSGAAAAYLTVSTYKKHLGNAYTRLGVHSVPEAVIAAVRLGILPVSVVTDLTGEAEAPATRTPRRPAVQCSEDGCERNTRHTSGTCTDHRP